MKNTYWNCIVVFILFTAPLMAVDALIWNPGSKATASANAINASLTANGKSSTVTTDIKTYTLSNYAYVFICLGVNPSTYVLSATTNSTEIQNLTTYLNQGGKVYMEGGDTWAWDFPTSFHGKFYIYGEADGEADLATISTSFCDGESASAYTIAQNYIDRIAPQEGAAVFFTNSSPAYACGIAYNNSSYRTLGVSFQFSGWDASKRTALMASILQFFNSGCALGKPAPLSVQAFSGYHNVVPLVWDAPPGQVPLEAVESEKPSLLYSSEKQPPVDQALRQKRPGRKLEDRMMTGSLPQTQIRSYQATSYNIYRSFSASGPFALLASAIDKQYYRDESATNGVEVFYKIKAVYNGSEGNLSVAVSAVPQENGYSQTVPWKFNTPLLNGQIQPDEWSNAAEVMITRPGGSEPIKAYVFNDNNYLYLAVDDAANTSLSVDDQIGLYFDQNNDLRWGSASFTEEGNIWISNGAAAKFRGLKGWWPFDIQWGKDAAAAGVQSAISAASGRVQYEARIDLSSSALDSPSGSDPRIYLYSFDVNNSTYTGAWPNSINTALWKDAWMIPALYGSFHLSEQGACPWIADDETIVSTGILQFNEFGDGRAVDLNVAAVGAGGTMTVRQTNGCLQNPINDQYINAVWSITGGAGVDILSTDIVLNYSAGDESARNESRLKVHRWTGTTWQYEGGVVNSAANQVTIHADLPGEFALFEREHVLLSLNLFLQGAYLSNRLMKTDLATNSFIPTVSTFSDARKVARIPADVVDWVMVELRRTPDGAPVSRRSFFVKNNGSVVDWDGTATSLSMPDAVEGSYYIVIEHRNHLAIMSAAPVDLNSSTAVLYDFTDATGRMYGNDAKLLESGVYGMYTGDANGNGQVQNDDKNDIWKVQVGTGGYQSADFNLNGQVQNDDKNDFWKLNVGKGTQVP